ncbi:FAD-dependent monooxygenase [Polymorphospora sp. NPDC051019]|uniref:FAD-dependent oxidoreductase n=1 Tax=Polymorphospora sp. NPDC051019 TaxID=3155725 RepID=UPI00342AB80D
MTHAERAVVVGASIAGLLAARALSETYAHVTVVDRDPLPDASAARRGVPQGRQLHVLLARGREVLEELFPGLSEEVAALGGAMVDLQDDVHWYNDGFRMRRAPSPMTAFGVSRPLLEHVVRTRVRALSNVTLLPDTEVLGPTATPDARRVTGVRVRVRTADAPESTIDADLVVDAGGRGSRSPVWLDRLGYAPAPEERVRVDVTYVTRTYRREPDQLEGLLGALTNATPALPRGGIVAVQEGDRFAVAICGMLGEEPPHDDEDLVRYAETLAAPQIGALLRSAVPASPPVRMRFPASLRRRYERLRRFPDGYLVIGDALCSFNPIYGQGMTVAALEALLLRDLLAAGGTRLARRFFQGAARVVDGPWAISVGTDLRFPAVPGRRTPKVRFVNAYVERVHAGAVADPELGAAFLRVLNLIDPPTRLLAPRTVWRVLRAGRRRPTVPVA